jgi:hypothetical protein
MHICETEIAMHHVTLCSVTARLVTQCAPTSQMTGQTTDVNVHNTKSNATFLLNGVLHTVSRQMSCRPTFTSNTHTRISATILRTQIADGVCAFGNVYHTLETAAVGYAINVFNRHIKQASVPLNLPYIVTVLGALQFRLLPVMCSVMMLYEKLPPE